MVLSYIADALMRHFTPSRALLPFLTVERALPWLAMAISLVAVSLAHAESKQLPATSAPTQVTSVTPGVAAADVVVFNRHIVTFRAVFLGLPPAARAERSRMALTAMLDKGGPGVVSVKTAPQGAILMLDNQIAFLIMPDDVDPLSGDTLDSTTLAAADALQQAIEATRESRDHQRQISSLTDTLISSLIYIFLVWLVWRLRTRLAQRLSERLNTEGTRLRIANKEIFSLERSMMLARWLTLAMSWLAWLTLTYWWISHVLAQFPYTRPWAEQFDGELIGIAFDMGKNALSALPGLVTAVAIFVIARMVVRFLSSLFDHLESGQGNIGVLNADTARPTRRLVTMGIWVFAFVMAYPYLPGSNSDAFKGISVLIGLMISLGGSSLFGQAASGLILMYSRILRVGEYVQVSGYEGTVTDLGMFTTKMRTGLGEELIIPNSLLLGAVTKNYSRAVQGPGFVVDTTVTIGYDTPWRQVEAMLIEAARRTPGVLEQPAPQVFQTALSDFYPEYRLVCQAIPADPRPRAQVLAALHANIQDVFNEYDVQIMSPHYLGDPARAKVVPKDQWHAAPAAPEDNTDKPE